jgi:3-oxoacyl-[acyl-carrier-protein] synthase II
VLGAGLCGLATALLLQRDGHEVSIAHGLIPPTLNLENKAPEVDLDVVTGAPRQQALRAALSNSFGFGGQNVSLLFTGN